MADELDYKKLYEQEKKKVSVLEQHLRLYQLPGDMRAYYALQKILNQQSDFLDKFEFETELKRFAKDDKTYDRASDVIEKLAVNVSRINALKIELGITGDEKKDTQSRKPSFLDKAIA